MKKRMLLSSILMTLVLLVAMSTATFAWYTANAGSVTKNTDSTGSISAATNEYAVGSITLTTTFSEIKETPVLTDEQGRVYYYSHYVSSGSEQNILLEDKATLTKSVAGSVKLVASIADNKGSASLAEAFAALGVETITLTVSIDKTGKIAKTATEAENGAYVAGTATSIEFTINASELAAASTTGITSEFVVGFIGQTDKETTAPSATLKADVQTNNNAIN